jgi:hypothetical protein
MTERTASDRMVAAGIQRTLGEIPGLVGTVRTAVVVIGVNGPDGLATGSEFAIEPNIIQTVALLTPSPGQLRLHKPGCR